jgi:hypothetical protein
LWAACPNVLLYLLIDMGFSHKFKKEVTVIISEKLLIVKKWGTGIKYTLVSIKTTIFYLKHFLFGNYLIIHRPGNLNAVNLSVIDLPVTGFYLL